MPETIRIWIGSEEKTRIPCKVLQHSILRHTNNPVEFHVNEGQSWVKSKDHQGTGFSLQRWQIASYFEYLGKCIYLDADQLAFADLLDLWHIDKIHQERSSIYCTYQPDKWYEQPVPNTSVMLVDCETAQRDWLSYNELVDYVQKDSSRKRYVEVMHGLNVKSPPIQVENSWNHLNTYIPASTKILHYTIEPKQPWYYPAHHNKDQWRDALLAALHDRFVDKEEVKEAVSRYKPHTKRERGCGMHPYWLKFVRD